MQSRYAFVFASSPAAVVQSCQQVYGAAQGIGKIPSLKDLGEALTGNLITHMEFCETLTDNLFPDHTLCENGQIFYIADFPSAIVEENPDYPRQRVDEKIRYFLCESRTFFADMENQIRKIRERYDKQTRPEIRGILGGCVKLLVQAQQEIEGRLDAGFRIQVIPLIQPAEARLAVARQEAAAARPASPLTEPKPEPKTPKKRPRKLVTARKMPLKERGCE